MELKWIQEAALFTCRVRRENQLVSVFVSKVRDERGLFILLDKAITVFNGPLKFFKNWFNCRACML